MPPNIYNKINDKKDHLFYLFLFTKLHKTLVAQIFRGLCSDESRCPYVLLITERLLFISSEGQTCIEVFIFNCILLNESSRFTL